MQLFSSTANSKIVMGNQEPSKIISVGSVTSEFILPDLSLVLSKSICKECAYTKTQLEAICGCQNFKITLRFKIKTLDHDCPYNLVLCNPLKMMSVKLHSQREIPMVCSIVRRDLKSITLDDPTFALDCIDAY